jgi:hypothetical protein
MNHPDTFENDCTSLFCKGVNLQQMTASHAMPMDFNSSGQFRNVIVMLTPSIISPYCLYGSSFSFRL